MPEFFAAGGYMMWPILICGVLVLGIAATTGAKLFRPGERPLTHVRSGIDAILFWGGFALVLGVLGTVVGVMQMAQAVERVGQVHTTLVWGGFKVALITTTSGLLVLSVAMLAWFSLWLRYRSLAPGRAATHL